VSGFQAGGPATSRNRGDVDADSPGEFDPFAPFDEGRNTDELAALGDLRELYESEGRNMQTPVDPSTPPGQFPPPDQAWAEVKPAPKAWEPNDSRDPHGPRDRSIEKALFVPRPIPPWETERGVSPWRLFFCGTFSFPFSWDALANEALLIGISVAWFFLLANLSVVLEHSEGNPVALLSAGLLTAGSFICGAFWAIVAFPFGHAILRDTSYANDQVEWPNVLMFDCLGDLMVVFAALCYAAFPGFLFSVSRMCPQPYRIPCVVGACFGLFPIVLLSMSEANSPVVPITRLILRSLFRAWWAWLTFYVVSFLAMGGVAIAIIALLRLELVSIAILVGSVLVNLTWVLYFRLFGRLAWYCSYVLAADAPADDDNETHVPSGDGSRE
jgi:hypothetical protein